MHSFSLKKTLSVAKTEYIKWVCNPRMIILLVLLIFIYTCAVEPLLQRSYEMNSPLNMLEPFIAIGNSGVLVMIMPAVFLALMSDFPRTDGNTLFFLIRTGKTNWLLGEFLFALMSIVSFFAVVFLGSVVPLFGKTFWGNGWSLVVRKYDILYPHKAGGFASQLIPGNLYNQLPPFSAALQTFILLFFYLLVLTLILMFFNLVRLKIFGIFTAGTVITLGMIFTSLKISAMWCFPMANAIIWLHYTTLYREPIKPIAYSYVFFAVLLTTLFTANVVALRRLSLITVWEVD